MYLTILWTSDLLAPVDLETRRSRLPKSGSWVEETTRPSVLARVESTAWTIRRVAWNCLFWVQ